MKTEEKNEYCRRFGYYPDEKVERWAIYQDMLVVISHSDQPKVYYKNENGYFVEEVLEWNGK